MEQSILFSCLLVRLTQHNIIDSLMHCIESKFSAENTQNDDKYRLTLSYEFGMLLSVVVIKL